MNKLIAGLCCLMLASPFVLAQDKAKGDEKKAAKATEKAVEKKAAKAPSEAQKKQQERMADCNKQAGDKSLKGDERKKFMNSCLKGGSAEPRKATQQDRMKDCNKQAGDKKMKGDERKSFMSACLKG